VNNLEKKCQNIDDIIKNNNKYINILKQAKQSLISESVTGKIDLRDWKIEDDLNE
jgi:type I restriction enzyme S subunit